MIERKEIQVCGIVQSVGFRPFVYSLAQRYGLKGVVRNNQRGVWLDLEGESAALKDFLRDLQAERPVLAAIDSIECRNDLGLKRYRDFRIDQTTAHGPKLLPVAADVATCAECLRELFDPRDRRFRYPFINCTNCGPRFTIIEQVPYDRANTTMRDFEMCAACRAEYENPLDRRFHAEPTACAQCGPQVFLTQTGKPAEVIATAFDAVSQAVLLLTAGKILAIKGVGGFHLACDAPNEEAVTALRRRKYREDKPFALMARSVEMVKQYCVTSTTEEALLCSVERPIVLLKRRDDCTLPDAIAPRVKTLGFMLPYSPLHHLLLETFAGPLVMTSANISDEPICFEDDDARDRLAHIADYFLNHNRRIHMRTDDSVVRIQTSSRSPTVLRRSRGYAPAPIKTALKFERQILACGAELKNTFCLARDAYAFISHHIGDLENLETYTSFTSGIEHFQRLFGLEPTAVAYDLHPEYLSTKYALALENIDTKIGVQHHHAHVASCMVDNEIAGDVIGVAMDGLGFGLDGRLWGGEFFVANFREAERFAHLDYVPLPGGAKAIREPWRMAAMYLQAVFGDNYPSISFVAETGRQKLKTIQRVAASRTNSPETSSMGRLFDAVSSLLCLRDVTNYEGQAAVELEQIANEHADHPYSFEFSNGVINAETVIQTIVADLLDGVPPAIISTRFHAGVASLITSIANRIRDEYKLNRVVLSGGVFQNSILVCATLAQLESAGFEVFTHRRVPPNDGGISLGQAAIANARLKHGTGRFVS